MRASAVLGVRLEAFADMVLKPSRQSKESTWPNVTFV